MFFWSRSVSATKSRDDKSARMVSISAVIICIYPHPYLHPSKKDIGMGNILSMLYNCTRQFLVLLIYHPETCSEDVYAHTS